MGAQDKNFYVELAERPGHGEAARAVQDAYLDGDRRRAAALLTDELIDAMALACTPAQLDDRLAAYEAVGVDHAAWPSRAGRTGRRSCARWPRRPWARG